MAQRTSRIRALAEPHLSGAISGDADKQNEKTATEEFEAGGQTERGPQRAAC